MTLKGKNSAVRLCLLILFAKFEKLKALIVDSNVFERQLA